MNKTKFELIFKIKFKSEAYLNPSKCPPVRCLFHIISWTRIGHLWKIIIYYYHIWVSLATYGLKLSKFIIYEISFWGKAWLCWFKPMFYKLMPCSFVSNNFHLAFKYQAVYTPTVKTQQIRREPYLLVNFRQILFDQQKMYFYPSLRLIRVNISGWYCSSTMIVTAQLNTSI